MYLKWHSLIQANFSNITRGIVSAVCALHQLQRCPPVRMGRVPWVLCLRLKVEGTKRVTRINNSTDWKLVQQHHKTNKKAKNLQSLTSSASTSSSYSWMPPPPYTQTPTSTTPGLSTVRQMASGEPLPVFQLRPWLVLVKRFGDAFTEWSEFSPST